MINYLKEQITYLRFWIGIYSVIAITLGSWIISNLDLNFKFFLACSFEAIILNKIFQFNQEMKNIIEQIGEIEDDK